MSAVRAVPMPVSQRNPPLQPPVAHELGPGFTEKLHSVLPHILPAVQSYGTVNVTAAPEACSQPVGWDGTDCPALRSVYRAGLEGFSADLQMVMVSPWPYQIVKGQWFTTVKVRFDPGPALLKVELGDGVRGIEVGFSDDAAVIARVVILRLREHTFISVEEMGENVQAVLFRHFSQPRRLMGLESAALPPPKVALESPSLESLPERDGREY